MTTDIELQGHTITEYYCMKCREIFIGDGESVNEHYECGTLCDAEGDWGDHA